MSKASMGIGWCH